MAEPEVKLKKSNEKLVMPTPRPLNESIGPEYKPEPPPRKPLGKINPSTLADVELRADMDPAMIDPFSKLGYRLVELGDVDFLAYIQEKGMISNVGGQYFKDKKEVARNLRDRFSIFKDLEKQGIKVDDIPSGGIATVTVGRDKRITVKGEEIKTMAHELGHAAFEYLRSKNLLPPNFQRAANQREETFITALDYLRSAGDKFNFGRPEEIYEKAKGFNFVPMAPYLEEKAFKSVDRGTARELFGIAEKELRKLGVPPEAQRMSEVPVPVLRSEVFPKPPPTRSSQLNMIERLFGRFLRKN